MITIIFKLSFILLVVMLSHNIFAQEGSKSNLGIFGAIREAKIELNETDIGDKLEIWQSSLKENNIKLKMLFDPEGFEIILELIRLGNKLTRDNSPIEKADVNTIASFVFAAERLGCKAPTGLTETLITVMNANVGKTWRECIQHLKSNDLTK